MCRIVQLTLETAASISDESSLMIGICFICWLMAKIVNLGQLDEDNTFGQLDEVITPKTLRGKKLFLLVVDDNN